MHVRHIGTHSMRSLELHGDNNAATYSSTRSRPPSLRCMAEMATTGNPTSINHIFDFDAPRTELDGPTYADLPTTGIHPRC